MKYIEREWDAFSKKIFAKLNPSPVQVEETKRGFFAGAHAVLRIIEQIGEPEISEDDGVVVLEALKLESQEFYKHLLQKYSETN